MHCTSVVCASEADAVHSLCACHPAQDSMIKGMGDIWSPLVAVQALLDIDPDAYFLLSGTGQAARYPGMAWGNGFISDLATIKQYQLSDPAYFFRDLSQAPRLIAHTLLSPKVLGPSKTVCILPTHALPALTI